MALPAEDTGSTFVWGANGAQLTPEQIANRRKIADALMAQGTDASPLPAGTRGAGVYTQGLARLAKGISAGLDYRDADRAEQANRLADSDTLAKVLAAYTGGGSAAPGVSAVTSAMPGGGSTPAALSSAPAAPDTSGKIYSNDEPSPLDPPSGQDRTRMIATILGEAGNEPQIGKNAIASVIRTRAVDGGYGGDTPSGVVTAPNQFEPWNTAEGRARMASAATNPQLAAQADAAIRSAYGEGGKAPEDPTEGMTHFYSPAGQAAMGRAPPAWAGGESVTIGGHVFNSPDDAPGKAVQVASADPGALPANAAPTQGYAIPGQGTPAVSSPATPGVAKVSSAISPALIQAYTSPYTSPATKQIVGMMLQSQLSKEKKDTFSQQTDTDGNIWSVNNATGQRTVALKATENPTSIREYEYAKEQAQKAGQPFNMDYPTWTIAKARAAATSINNVGNTTAETELNKTVGKAQGEVIGEDIKAGSHAANKLRQLATLDEANKSGGDDISSGPLGKAILSGKQGLSELTGIDLKGVPESEVIQKVGFGLATNMVKAITNRPSQMEFGKALENVPGLYMSKQGRVAMTSILTQDARAEQELGRLANKPENHKNWQEVKDKYYEDHPLMSPFTGKPFGEADIQMLTKAGSGVATNAAAQPTTKTINGYTIKELP